MAGHINPLLTNCERGAKAAPFSVGAAGRPLCAHERAERRKDVASDQAKFLQFGDLYGTPNGSELRQLEWEW